VDRTIELSWYGALMTSSKTRKRLFKFDTALGGQAPFFDPP
jgi:hypothetical protein